MIERTEGRDTVTSDRENRGDTVTSDRENGGEGHCDK